MCMRMKRCQLMGQGHSEADVIKSMTEQNAGFTTDGATKFTKRRERLVPPRPESEPAGDLR
jgi:hypothetical protein